MSITWRAKAPTEEDTREHDFTAMLDEAETVTSYTATRLSGTATAARRTVAPTDRTAIFDVAGGLEGEAAIFDIVIVTNARPRLVERIILPVMSINPAAYGSDGAFASWLAVNGYTLPSGPSLGVLRQRGSAYIDALYGAEFIGMPTGSFSQERAWPRTGAIVHGAAVPDTDIPPPIIHASYAAAWHEANNPGSLAVTASAAAAVKREKVGPIEVEYVSGSGDAAADATVRISAVEGLVAPFLNPQPVAGILLRAVG